MAKLQTQAIELPCLLWLELFSLLFRHMSCMNGDELLLVRKFSAQVSDQSYEEVFRRMCPSVE